MRNHRSEEEICGRWKGDLSRPVVSIACTAYNHAPFIEDALAGFLMQETDFPFEILIHDDASSDGTAEIIRRYARHYPNLFRPLFQTENQFSRGFKPNPEFNFSRARGVYIAVCEGDDYWTDPKKLQIQVDFLNSHPEYVISGHDAFVIDEKGRKVQESKMPVRHKRDGAGEELVLNKIAVPTMSRVFRNVLGAFPPEGRMILNGDIFITSLLGHYGMSKYHPEIGPACYRRHGGGIWSAMKEKEQRDAAINSYYWIYRYYKRMNQGKYSAAYWDKYTVLVLRSTDRKRLMHELANRFFRSLRSFLGLGR
ncbi:MAG: glycosyltransferase [Deltaproteobacteria bacterium]|nr:glycosyltransferase [Deltaproteobacteria bacterium]